MVLVLGSAAHVQSDNRISQDVRDVQLSVCKIYDEDDTGLMPNLCECGYRTAASRLSAGELDSMNRLLEGAEDDTACDMKFSSLQQYSLEECLQHSHYECWLLMSKANHSCFKKLGDSLPLGSPKVDGLSPQSLKYGDFMCREHGNSENLCKCALSTTASQLSAEEKKTMNDMFEAETQGNLLFKIRFSGLYMQSMKRCLARSYYK